MNVCSSNDGFLCYFMHAFIFYIIGYSLFLNTLPVLLCNGSQSNIIMLMLVKGVQGSVCVLFFNGGGAINQMFTCQTNRLVHIH